jgi:hypothetical protein
MAAFVFSDNARSSLGQAIGPGATVITLAAGGGAAFPIPAANQQFALTLNDLATRVNYEVCYCTARTGDVLTVLRGQEGTTAQSWVIGDYAWNGPTSGQMSAMVQIPHMTDASIAPVFANTTVQGWLQTTNYIDTTNQVRSSTGFISRGMDPYGQFRAIGGAYGVMLRNDGANAYWLQTNANDANGSWTALRPFAWNLSTGAVTIDGSGAGIYCGGNLSTTQNITAGYLSSSGNVNAGNTFTGGNVSVNGTVWAGGWVGSAYVYSNGNINAAGTYTGGTVAVGGNVSGYDLHAAGAVYSSNFVNANSDVNAGGTVNAGYVHSRGDVNADHDVNANSNMMCNGELGVGGYGLSGGWFGLAVDQQLSRLVYWCNQPGNGFALKWLQTAGWYGTMTYQRPDGAHLFQCDYSGNVSAYSSIWAPNICDDRAKRAVRPYQRGLNEIISLEPVSFQYNGEGDTVDDGTVYYGVSAQKTRDILPEAVVEIAARMQQEVATKRLPGMLGIEEPPVLWALVNACKELATRVATLEYEVKHLKEQRQ